MPFVEPNTISDVPSKERDKLRRYLHERDVLGYAFSYSKLFKLVSTFLDKEDTHEALQDCILAFDTSQEDETKKELNDKISEILLENGMKGIRSPDPFNRLMDCTIYESTSAPRFNRNKAIEIAPKYGVSTSKMMEILEASTTPGSQFVAVRVVAVKEKEEKE